MKNKKKHTKDLAASIRARLLNIAKINQQDFNAVLLQYFQERFLYRLSVSPYKDNMILKGALLFLINQIPRLRPTKDIDFLGVAITNDQDNVESIIRDILIIKADDGVMFNSDSVSSEIITEQAEYPGIRVYFECSLAAAQRRLRLDIGFGDEIVPHPVTMDFPVLLDDQAIPSVLTYSLESSIAEKFEAIVKYNFLTSRMKDFYDIWYISNNSEFNYQQLKDAIFTTFKNRLTPLREYKIVFSANYKLDESKNVQWKAFLNRNKIDCHLSFSEIVEKLEKFLLPICILEKEEKSTAIWDPTYNHWIE